jgi:hypothetical protein
VHRLAGEPAKEEAMRIIAIAMTVMFAAGAAGVAVAQTQLERAHKLDRRSEKRQEQPQAPAAKARNGYIQHNADKLPFGTSDWWDQMLREGRAGTCCN